ncbi:MAG: PAS domain S-box protein [Candidatus Rokuibacteriota bacterium]
MASSRRRSGNGASRRTRARRKSEARHRDLSALTAAQVRGLECIGSGAPLSEALATLARTIEALSDGMLVSILLLDEDGVHLRHGAAPSLPEAYVRAIDGTAIGPDVGSCGSAAYLAQPIVASKIQSDPRWVSFRELALGHGLQACWSTPIMSMTGRVLGTFAMYYREPREPGLWEMRLIEIATHLARIVIEHDRAEAERARLAGLLASAPPSRPPDERYRLLFERNLAAVFRTTRDGRILECNQSFAALLGYPSPEAVVRVDAKNIHVDPAQRERLLARLGTGETVTNHEMRWRRADGHVVVVLVNVQEIHEGAATVLEGVASDITERRRGEEVAREAIALRSVAHLANAAAHEINNPLTTVVGRLEMLMDGLPKGSAPRAHSEKALAACDQIRDIVTRMHHVTRIEYLINLDQRLPPTLDIRRSSDEE